MDNIRFILIVVFAMLVFMLWQAWQVDYGPKPPVATVTDPNTTNAKEDLPSATGTPAPTETAKQETSAVPSVALPSAKIIKVKTDVLALEIDTQGGTVRNLDLLTYPVEKENTVVIRLRDMLGLPASEKNLAPTRLFDSNPDKLFVAQSGLITEGGSTGAASHHTIFTNEKDSYVLEPGQESLTVPLTWTDSSGLVVTKLFTFKRGSYQIGLEQKVQNNSAQPWTGRQYSQLMRVPYQDDKGNTFIRTYSGGVLYTEEEKYQKVDFDDMAEENLNVTTKGGWTAMIQHYFAAAWIPPADQENHFYTKELQNEHYVIGAYSAPVTVPSNSNVQFATQLFAGPKIQPMMENIANGLELTVDYGWLTIIGKPIYWLLNQIYNVVGNWGWAIIGVTLCIKLLFFPLSQASYRSMAKMRKIQPRLKEMQERFADDRPRFNKEMMDLYKREKVNPLGGCLPILIQIPVFISLYWVLVETVEIRQAPFLLWIQDLSAMDPFYVLPVLMGITMKIQQSLNPAPIDPIQAKIMKMFPIVFTIFFLFFPAGLVLYWVVNNTLSIIQQWYITKQINEAK
ncbi:membrane protein insertase YidC [Methylobacter luteus]|uniref:membrane protein insertase YidC n=1 Tax=Methylobacter luteus TaxID=415 RepID=UPI0004816949|nr:membrane protein insertase YidC [Methylobacter luteus]